MGLAATLKSRTGQVSSPSHSPRAIRPYGRVSSISQPVMVLPLLMNTTRFTPASTATSNSVTALPAVYVSCSLEVVEVAGLGGEVEHHVHALDGPANRVALGDVTGGVGETLDGVAREAAEFVAVAEVTHRESAKEAAGACDEDLRTL